MAKIINIIGQKFGKLTVINMRSDRGNSNQIMYDCKCDCGFYAQSFFKTAIAKPVLSVAEI